MSSVEKFYSEIQDRLNSAAIKVRAIAFLVDSVKKEKVPLSRSQTLFIIGEMANELESDLNHIKTLIHLKFTKRTRKPN